MNVMEAIEIRNNLQRKIDVFARVIMNLEPNKKDFNYELKVLNDVKNDLHDEKNKIEERLGKSQLAPEVLTRGV
jgi:hypothetical protein